MSAIRYIIAGVASLPVALMLTIVMLPLWRWFEATTGIETIGHSGPAAWCYAVIYIFLLLCVVVFNRQKNRGSRITSSD